MPDLLLGGSFIRAYLAVKQTASGIKVNISFDIEQTLRHTRTNIWRFWKYLKKIVSHMFCFIKEVNFKNRTTTA